MATPHRVRLGRSAQERGTAVWGAPGSLRPTSRTARRSVAYIGVRCGGARSCSRATLRLAATFPGWIGRSVQCARGVGSAPRQLCCCADWTFTDVAFLHHGTAGVRGRRTGAAWLNPDVVRTAAAYHLQHCWCSWRLSSTAAGARGVGGLGPRADRGSGIMVAPQLGNGHPRAALAARSRRHPVFRCSSSSCC